MYFFDALYGEVDLNISKELLCSPELQRLREIRLCNINSPFITGGTSLNRFEHAIGTAYLAQETIKIYTSDKHDEDAFVVASLLHDIVTAPFGHSLEYLFESAKNAAYEHANIWQMIFTGRTIPSSRNFFAGKKAALQLALNQAMIQRIQDILELKHPLSSLLVNAIDIDNIDNVFRFAFHLGISFEKKVPLFLAKNLHYEKDILRIDADAIHHFEVWFQVRRQLYKYLLEDEGEFVAKALLERAFIECFNDDLISEYDWVLTDAEMVDLILHKGNATAQKSIQRLMLMDFPEQGKIFVARDYKRIDSLLSKGKLGFINYAFTEGVLLHFIRDVNKTCRQLLINTTDGNGVQETIGYPDDRYLIGVFSDNAQGMKRVEKYLRDNLNIDFVDISETRTDETQTSFFQS